MRVDREIDERMNIASASRGAAKYLKKNNLYFNNWVYALQSYQMGAGGVQRSAGDKHNGDKHMEITSDTYWYVKKYLAHKVAFEGSMKGEPQVKVMDYQPNEAMTTKAIATKLSIEEARLLEYNKWILKGHIPDDRKYTVLIPVGEAQADLTDLVASSKPAVKESSPKETSIAREYVNGVPAVRALSGESLAALASRGQIGLTDLLKYNEISTDHKVKANAYYFVEKKKTQAEKTFHQLAKGESLWAVSQRYGVQLRKLKKYNRLKTGEDLPAGATVWLSSKMPKRSEQSESDVIGISDETFEWQIGKSGNEVKNTIPTPVTQEAFTKDTIQQIQAKVIKTAIPEPTSQTYALETPAVTQSAPTIHEVKPSDTLYSVARQYGVTIKDLMDWNDKTNFSVSIGEKLKVIPK